MKVCMYQDVKESIRIETFFLFLITFFAIILIFSNLGGTRMPSFDDCYFAQKAKEMIQTGDWFTLYYKGRISLDHAPLYVWLIAIMFKFFGVSEFSARFFSAFFGVATIVAVYFLGKMLFNKWIGLFASFVLLTTPLFLVYSRRAMFDITFAFWVTLAIYFFMRGVKKRGYFLLFGVSTGITILTKSVLGFFPIVIVIVYFLLQKEFKRILDPFFLSGIIIALLVSLPWYIYQYINYPEQFVNTHLKWLIFKGAFVHKKVRPPFWYLQQLVIYYWPWLPLATYSFIKLAAKNVRKVDPHSLMMLSWTVVIIGVMSFMHVKKEYYILSGFPPLALITAISLDGILADERRKIFFVKFCSVFLLLLSIITVATPLKVPIRLKGRNNPLTLVDDTWAVANFAREKIPKNEKIVLYRLWFTQIRNSYLFYSDRDISASFYKKDPLLKTLREGKARYCLTTKEDFKELSLAIKYLKPQIVQETPSLVLFKTM